MKKLLILFLLINASISANAQGKFDFSTDRELMFDALHSIVAVIALYISVAFILSLIRLWMNYQLRKKLLENEASADIITQILLNKSENLNPLKWFIILVFIGIGLLIISFLGPLDMLSVIIMTLCIAFGFLSYYFVGKRLNSR
jgi:hypothetical protein